MDISGTGCAVPQVPFVSSTTSAWLIPRSSKYCPAPPQLPGDGQETDWMPPPVVLSTDIRSACGVPQPPLPSSATNACILPPFFVKNPPAEQSPAAAHDTDSMPMFPSLVNMVSPGSSIAAPQV